MALLVSSMGGNSASWASSLSHRVRMMFFKWMAEAKRMLLGDSEAAISCKREATWEGEEVERATRCCSAAARTAGSDASVCDRSVDN